MNSSPEAILKKYFGYSSFRAGQESVIQAVLTGRDVLLLMPTGGGKSLCYQIPALMLKGTCIVISPLISLMKDQVDALKANGVAAAFLNSAQSQQQQQDILEACYRGQIALLYVSPEKLMNDITQIGRMVKPSMIAIDEAHCISAWGHDFRPEYTQLGFLRERFYDIPFIALTATADKLTRSDIVRQLGLNDPRVFISSFNRPNLSLDVRVGLKPSERLKEIVSFIRSRPQESGIIYCLSRNKCDEMAQLLRNNGIKASCYHAGMSAHARAAAQDDFINDVTQIVCATVAFGMGIDKSNVRWVIHNNMPKNMEGYYQEIGRAGRDGLPSSTILYYSYADMAMLSQFASEGSQKELNLEKLNRMQQYAEADICRRKILLNYFSENLQDDCGNCDVCRNPREHFDGTILVQKALSAIARSAGRESMPVIIDILRGYRSEYILAHGLERIKTFGVGSDMSAFQWQRYLVQMLNQGIIEIAYDQDFALKITPMGNEILLRGKKAKLSVLKLPEKRSSGEQHGSPATANATDQLFGDLRQLRLKLAMKSDIPAYAIFSDVSLHEMARFKPVTEEALLEISGVGEFKLRKYGHHFIKLIREKTGKGKPAASAIPRFRKPRSF